MLAPGEQEPRSAIFWSSRIAASPKQEVGVTRNYRRLPFRSATHEAFCLATARPESELGRQTNPRQSSSNPSCAASVPTPARRRPTAGLPLLCRRLVPRVPVHRPSYLLPEVAAQPSPASATTTSVGRRRQLDIFSVQPPARPRRQPDHLLCQAQAAPASVAERFLAPREASRSWLHEKLAHLGS